MRYFIGGLLMTICIGKMKRLRWSQQKYLPSTSILQVFICRFDCAQDGGQAFLWAVGTLKISFSTQKPKIAQREFHKEAAPVLSLQWGI